MGRPAQAAARQAMGLRRAAPCAYALQGAGRRYEYDCEGMQDREDLAAFIRSSFPSVWSFEIVLLLKRRAGRWSHADIVEAMRASDLIVSQSLSSLTAAGLVDEDESRFGYAPVNEATSDLMDRAESLYETRPNRVRRVIVTRNTPGLAAFADAFRLRDD